MKLIAAATAVLLATPALAQDAAADWTGFYAGQGFVSSKATSQGDVEEFIGVNIAVGYLKDAGSFAYGAEIGYQADRSKDKTLDADIKSTGLKAIVGYDLGKSLVFASAGSIDSEVTAQGDSISDNLSFVGIGARHVFMDKYVAGIEFMRAKTDDLAGTGTSLQNDIVSIRLDYKF